MIDASPAKPMTQRPDLAAPADDTADARIIRRVTLRLIPFLMLCYVIANLNRVNLSFAALQMNRDLALSATTYGFGAGLFFVTYCLCEIPSNLMLHKYGASRWIARIMASWGLVAVATAFITGPISFFTLRLLLGAAEAGFYPGVLFFLTLWFPAAQRGRIIGLFFASIPISGIIGGPLSGWLLTWNGLAGLHGWQWLYLVEGAPAIALAPLVLVLIRDRPDSAPWLPAAERERLIAMLADGHHPAAAQPARGVAQVVLDPRVLLLAATFFSNVCLLNGITFFLPQIVKGFGLGPVQTGFVVAVPSVLALVTLLWWGRRSDAAGERFGHAALANLVGGAALLVAMLLHNPAAQIAAIAVSFASTLAFAAPFWAIPGAFLAGRSAAIGIATISALGVTGGLAAPWVIGALHDATGDFRAGLGLFACLAMGVTAAFYRFGATTRT
jgi:MFS family permease